MADEFIHAELVGDSQVVAHVQSMNDVVRAHLTKTLYKEALDLEADIKTDALSGGVLNMITGNLKASVFTKPIEQDGDTVSTAVVQGGEIKYGAIHEFGFDGSETVRSHIRTMVFGRTVPAFTVPEFVRHMHMPERSFMRSTLARRAPTIIDHIEQAGIEGARESMR